MRFLSYLLTGVLWLLPLSVLAAAASGRYDQIISATAWQYGLEPAMVKAVVKCESGFNPWAQSPRGAQGLMQLMPGTQTLLGVTDAFDPQRNVAGGVRYLAMMKETFHGNLTLMLAAYNAGPQAVINAGYTMPPYAETQQYVQCVLAARDQYAQGRPAWPLPGRRFMPAYVPPTTSLVVYPSYPPTMVRLGERLTLQLDAINTGSRPGHGIIMLNYPEHLVSFMALTSPGRETVAQLSSSPRASALPSVSGTTTYRLLSSHWPTWAPGERRTAMIALVPLRLQDITLHVSVVLDDPTRQGEAQRWSSLLRIPFLSGLR